MKCHIIEFQKGDRVQFWDFVDKKFILKTGTITKVRMGDKNFKIVTNEGETFFKWKKKLSLLTLNKQP